MACRMRLALLSIAPEQIRAWLFGLPWLSASSAPLGSLQSNAFCT